MRDPFTTFAEHCMRLRLYDVRFIGMHSALAMLLLFLGEHLGSARLGQWVQQTQLPVDSALVACISKSDKFEPEPERAVRARPTQRDEGQARPGRGRKKALPIHAYD